MEEAGIEDKGLGDNGTLVPGQLEEVLRFVEVRGEMGVCADDDIRLWM